MLSFFRRALGSWLVIALLGLVMIAFIVTGVSSPNSLGGGSAPGADSVATVDGKPVLAADVARQAEQQLQRVRQQRPDITMPQVMQAGGGVGALVEQQLTGRVLEAWAASHGIVASRRLIDGEIASIPAFQGPTGRFDQKQMQAVLGQQRISELSLREGMHGDLLRRQLLVPISSGSNPSPRFAEAYAGILIARREGQAGLVPFRFDKVPPPTDSEIAAYYDGHRGRYTLPERRVLRYAAVTLDTVPAAAPTDPEISARYTQDAAKYAARETRTLSQVVLPDEAAARAFAAKIKAGAPFAKAALDAGFAAADIALGTQEKPAFAVATTQAVADAAFALPKDGTTQPIKSVLGWHVVHVDAIAGTPARSLAQAKDEIAAALLKQKRADALAALAEKLSSAISDGATFDEVVKANNLAVTDTPPLTATGVNPTDAAFKADPTTTTLVKAGFLASPDDEPTVETVSPEAFALLAVARVLPSAPVPLAQIRANVVRDLIANSGGKAAADMARRIMDQVNHGTPIAEAFAKAGLAPPQPVGGSQIDLSRMQNVPPAVQTLFRVPAGRAGVGVAPNGWYVIRVERIIDGPPQIRTAIANQMRADLGKSIGDEYVEQFARAARADVTVKRNPAAIAALGRQLNGQAADTGQ